MGEVRRGGGAAGRGRLDRKNEEEAGNEADRFTVLPCRRCSRSRALVVVMTVMVVSVLPGGHPRCVPNKPTCWRDNGSTVTTQLLEREKRKREMVATTESIPITGKKQSSLSFNVE